MEKHGLPLRTETEVSFGYLGKRDIVWRSFNIFGLFCALGSIPTYEICRYSKPDAGKEKQRLY